MAATFFAQITIIVYLSVSRILHARCIISHTHEYWYVLIMFIMLIYYVNYVYFLVVKINIIYLPQQKNAVLLISFRLKVRPHMKGFLHTRFLHMPGQGTDGQQIF